MREDELIEILYTVIKESIDSLVLPTGNTLLPSLAFSGIIFSVSLISDILDIYSFISWQGAGIACLSLFALTLIERREDNEVSRLYRNAQLRAERVKSRLTSASSGNKDAGASDDIDTTVEKNGE